MKFCELDYKRIEASYVEAESKKIIARMREAKDYSDFRKALLDFDKMSSEIESQYTVCYIRHTIDTTDKFYAAESDFWDSELPKMEEFNTAVTKELLDSKFRKDLEAEFGDIITVNAELAFRCFSPEIIKELQEENALVTEYEKLIASAQIDFEGEKRTLSQLSPFKTDADDDTRRAAWQADASFYKQNGEKLDDLYDKLVEKRTIMGKKLGGENYVRLGYDRMTRNCYDANDVDKFRAAVRKYIVPIASEIKKQQAARIGVSYPMTFADDALSFRSGNPRPALDSDGILEYGKKMYHEMSEETAEFIDAMFEHGMFDLLSKKGKAAGGYCASVPELKMPFIFANFNGTQHDVEVMTHEAGHAFAGYTCRNMIPSMLISPTYESCEIHSMSMEFFAHPWAEGFFGKDTDKFLYSHLADALTFIPYGTMVDDFQNQVYAHPEYTPAERHALWASLEKTYRPWLALDGSDFYGEGKAWQRQTHIYERPFYYIDYCLAQTVALSFWALMQKDRKDAWERYLKLVAEGGKKTFKGLLETASLPSPFGEEALKSVAEAANEFLKNFDSEKLH